MPHPEPPDYLYTMNIVSINKEAFSLSYDNTTTMHIGKYVNRKQKCCHTGAGRASYCEERSLLLCCLVSYWVSLSGESTKCGPKGQAINFFVLFFVLQCLKKFLPWFSRQSWKFVCLNFVEEMSHVPFMSSLSPLLWNNFVTVSKIVSLYSLQKKNLLKHRSKQSNSVHNNSRSLSGMNTSGVFICSPCSWTFTGTNKFVLGLFSTKHHKHTTKSMMQKQKTPNCKKNYSDS